MFFDHRDFEVLFSTPLLYTAILSVKCSLTGCQLELYQVNNIHAILPPVRGHQ